MNNCFYKVIAIYIAKLFFNDPTAGSPTVTLLRLLLPLNYKIYCNLDKQDIATLPILLTIHRIIQSVGATGGVYKGQGRNQRELMTRAY